MKNTKKKNNKNKNNNEGEKELIGVSQATNK